MKLVAAGDAIIQRRIQPDFEGFLELTPYIQQGDARFFNLETTLNRVGEACASQFSGGTYLRADPEVLEDVKAFGFNMTSFNNNHALDFFYTGLEKTLQALDRSGLVHSGVGRNLAEASAPAYLDTENGRVALISVNTSFEMPMMAGEQTALLPGRPGINGLRIEKRIQLPQEDLDTIRRIAMETNFNAQKEITRREGYYANLPEGEAELGELKFCLADAPGVVETLNKADMLRVEKAIYEANLQADYIMVSVHSHQLSGYAKENPSEALIEFAHRCIDMGAHAIIGHGPHLLRPIEVYKDCPIFYSLGDFVLQLYNIEAAPQEFYAKYGLTPEAGIHALLKKRSKNFTVGLMTDPRMFRTVIPMWETEGTKLTKLRLMPVELAMEGNHSQIGLPRRSNNPEICDYLARMCEPYGTRFQMDSDGILVCSW